MGNFILNLFRDRSDGGYAEYARKSKNESVSFAIAGDQPGSENDNEDFKIPLGSVLEVLEFRGVVFKYCRPAGLIRLRVTQNSVL